MSITYRDDRITIRPVGDRFIWLIESKWGERGLLLTAQSDEPDNPPGWRAATYATEAEALAAAKHVVDVTWANA